MIKKSLLTCILLLSLHAAVVWLQPQMGMATQQWQDNIVKAQTFLYDETADTVMVGTSLSGRIIRDSIPTVRSVAFNGCAVEDGLRIVSHKAKLPRYILVETNLLFREGNDELVSRLTMGFLPRLRAWLPSLREQYEPICLLASVLMKSNNINAQAGAAKVDSKLLEESIQQRIRHDEKLDEATVGRRTTDIKALINNLERQGVTFIFFEMPVNERIKHLQRFEQTREVLQREFPDSRYLYLPPDTTSYVTTDGEHLDFEGQKTFSHYFKSCLERTAFSNNRH